jgi:hypothetical protein
MEGAGLEPCPEIEQLQPCVFFGSGKCPECYSERLFKLRKATSRHVHKATPAHGLVRLGTYIEILPPMWDSFKAGEGVWSCCGARWSRPDFRTRSYFLITRGLSPLSFYERVAADPACVNIQVSVDLWPDGTTIPDEDRLARFALEPKVIFRAKTTPENAHLWAGLFDRLSVAVGRVMETPLRSRVMETKLLDGHFSYGRKTLLEKAGWNWRSFLRCNTACADCRKENGVTACAVRPTTLLTLGRRARSPPPRHNLTLHDIAWRAEAQRFLAERGGRGTTKEAYAWFALRFPALVVGKPSWQFKVRVALQRAGVRTEDGKGWRLEHRTLGTWNVEPTPSE